MIYPSDFEQKIGFSQLRSLLREKTLSPLGAAQIDELRFSSDFNKIRVRLKQTSEMVMILQSARELPVENLHDATPWLVELRSQGAVATPDRLHKLRQLLLTASRIRDFFNIETEGVKPFPSLSALFGNLDPFPQLAMEIDRVINKFGEVKDSASPLLGEIRGKIRAAQASMSNLIRRVIRSAAQEGILNPDTTASMRDGRLVIPVEAGMKRRINGIVHDQSASGKTVYIEPAEVVVASNRLRELELDENREVLAILLKLSDLIRPQIDPLLRTCRLIGVMDFIRAKALFAIETGGQLPALERKPEIDWFHAVHPLLFLSLKLQGKEVVPLDINLSGGQKFLVISGPNAGGKSVTLKTVAIVQYMMQCGLLPSLYSNSHMGIFENVFIDIGDEQSIENDLSTYSSHLANMKFFLNRANDKTIVLADEMGSGTEPQIGGALAQAILSKLGKAGAFGIVTTHYQNLKQFASSEPGFVNGAMLYDRSRLQPMFKLSVGNAGSSFALDIARKTGLPEDVVSMAKEIVGDEYVNTDKYLLDIARDRRYWTNKRMSIREKEHKIERELDTAEQRAADLRMQRTAIIKEAHREAEAILAQANAKIERTILEIRNAQAEKEKTKQVRKELEDYRRKLKEDNVDSSVPEILKQKNLRKKKKTEQIVPSSASRSILLEAGDYVKMSSSGTVGKILSIKGNQAEVAFGALRTFVKISQLTKAKAPKNNSSKSAVNVTSDGDSRSRQLNFKLEIDVRGFRADEALQAVTYFIDDAIQFCIPRVRILHGTGTGALREAIRGLLKSIPSVESFADEDVRFGGAGITVVNLA